MTMHEYVLEEIVEKRMRDGWASLILDVRSRLRRREFDDEIVQAVFQHGMSSSVSIEDAYVFAQVWSGMAVGHIAVCRIDVGAAPLADRDREENQAALDAGLPYPFGASVEKGYDDDGVLDWSEPIRTTCGGQPYMFRPGGIALEIGSTAASRTLLHIRGQGGVARWAYDKTKVVLFLQHPNAPRPRML